MQRLRDLQWQSPHLAANGVAHVPWEPVFKSYEGLAEAADVLGRPDLAQALESRVTPQLCRAYAPLLSVLRRVARDPLSQPPVHFPPEKMRPTDEEIWAEAMQGIESELRPADFSASDDFEFEEVTENTDSSSATQKDEPQPPKPVLDLSTRAASVPSLSPRSLSHADFARELRLGLLGLGTLRPGSVTGMSDECYASVWARFDYCAAQLGKLPHDLLVEARFEITQWSPSTILQLLVNTEKLVLKYRRLPRRIDTSGIAMFLNGDSESPAVVRGGGEGFAFAFAFASNVPAELRHPLILQAGESAVLAARIHGVKLPQLAISYTSKHQYIGDIYRIHARNCELLMTSSLKERLSECWQPLAGVFLAQDPRTLIFLAELTTRSADNVFSDCMKAQRILDASWPDAPFVLDEQLVPMFVRELDSKLEAVLGSGLEKVFPRQRLSEAWAMILNAFKKGDQLVELLMAEQAANVQARIRSARTLEPFI